MRVALKNLRIKQESETPSGTVNGSNITFTLAFSPISVSYVSLYKNGLFQIPTTHYTLSGSTITFITAPTTNSDLYVTYWRNT